VLISSLIFADEGGGAQRECGKFVFDGWKQGLDVSLDA
jgi:hypothetical protein